MSDSSKLTSSHLRRHAFVYARQSSQAQVEHNVESTALQYALVERAIELGFTREQVVVIDDDLGISADGRSTVRGSGAWLRRSRLAMPDWCLALMSRVFLETMSIGTGCSICAV